MGGRPSGLEEKKEAHRKQGALPEKEEAKERRAPRGKKSCKMVIGGEGSEA